MVDNVAITAGSGTTIAADDIGSGVLVQRTKTTWGPDGTANDVDVATGKPLPVQLRSPTGTDLTGTAGTASTAVITVQGIASGVSQPVSATLGAETTKVIGTVNIAASQTLATVTNVATIAGTAPAFGDGAKGSTVLRTTLATDSAGIITTGTAGTPSTQVISVQGVSSGTPQPVSGTVSITDISSAEYETVAASQTAQALGATGATGDYISGLLVVPATTSPGNVLLLDNATSITVFAGGATSVSNLVPFFIPLGMKSVSGAWKVTTGSNVSVIGIGNFT
jgi:hypothetical protein